MSLLVMVAVTTPEVRASRVLASKTEAVPESTVIASFPRPLIPDES